MPSIPLPPGMTTVRYAPPPEVKLPAGDIPLIKPTDPEHMQVRQIWTAHARQFDLGKEDERQAYEEIWQSETNGRARTCQDIVTFNPQTGTYIAYCRWATFELVAPAMPGTGAELMPI